MDYTSKEPWPSYICMSDVSPSTRALEKIVRAVEAEQAKPALKRFWEHVKNPNIVEDLKKELDDALSHFQVRVLDQSLSFTNIVLYTA
jgi:hypothetical protein